jgi:arylsulfatase A-like enzyme
MKTFPLLFLSTVVFCALIRQAEAAALPNIVLIFVDDMGYGDLGCYGNSLNKTPHIDQLASEGQQWMSFYSSGATCVPSRRGLMTGRHPVLMGNAKLVGVRNQLLPAMLRKQGYATELVPNSCTTS